MGKNERLKCLAQACSVSSSRWVNRESDIMPKDVSVPVEKWSQALYGGVGGSLAQPEVSKLWGGGAASGIHSSPSGITDAIKCMQQNGDVSKCESHLDTLAKLGGYTEPEIKSTTTKASEFCSKAGSKLLAVPAIYVAFKFVKIK